MNQETIIEEAEVKPESKEKEIKWITKEDIIKKDEKILVEVWRFIKNHYELFLGMFVGALIQWLIMK